VEWRGGLLQGGSPSHAVETQTLVGRVKGIDLVFKELSCPRQNPVITGVFWRGVAFLLSESPSGGTA
jgi:hypothetical protein